MEKHLTSYELDWGEGWINIEWNENKISSECHEEQYWWHFRVYISDKIIRLNKYCARNNQTIAK